MRRAMIETELFGQAVTRLNRAVVVDAERRVLGVVSDDVLRSVGDALPEGMLGALMGATGRGPRSVRVPELALRGKNGPV